MNVVHVSINPVAGSPIRIVNALNLHTKVNARLITFRPDAYGLRTFENDLCWNNDKEKSLFVLDNADIIHLHQYFDLFKNNFNINFNNYLNRGKILIRQYHSVPWHAEWSVDKVLNEQIPKLVIGQFHERYYPNAAVVPNIVPINNPLYKPFHNKSEVIRIFFSPSTNVSAWDDRWATKGAPETIQMLKRLKNRFLDKIELVIVQNCPHALCMQKRRDCHIAIDELVTGSFHMTSLECLSQGLPTLAYLDDRICENLHKMTGANWLPWINTHLENAESHLVRLIEDDEYRIRVGKESRLWMEIYYDDSRLVEFFVRIYKELLENPKTSFPVRFDEKDPDILWKIRGAADALWDERRKRLGPPRYITNIKHLYCKGLRFARSLYNKYFRKTICKIINFSSIKK